MLAAAKEVARTAQPQILVGHAEAVRGGTENLHTGESLLILRVCDENAVRLLGTASDASAELVQLGKAVPLRVFDHHDRRVRHVHTHLHHRGGDKNVQFSRGKAAHDRVLFRAFHPSVQLADPQARQVLLPQAGGVLRYAGAIVASLVDHGADDVALPSFGRVTAQEIQRPGPLVGGDGVGEHRRAARRQLIEN